MLKNLSNENKAYFFALIGIILFSITAPATKVALGENNIGLSPAFITFGRSALAGFLAILYLILKRKKIPDIKFLYLFILSALTLTVGFPIGLSTGLQYSTSVHSAVILGFLPLLTAILASIYSRQKVSKLFWYLAFLGCFVLASYSLLNGFYKNKDLTFDISDNYIFFAVLSAAIGYNVGVKLTGIFGSVDVICWTLAFAFPFHLILSIYYYPTIEITPYSWCGFFYNAVFSQFVGFFFWYKGLDLGGAVKISQVQLLMPFLTFAFSFILLQEVLNFTTIFFSLVIIVIIYFTKKA